MLAPALVLALCACGAEADARQAGGGRGRLRRPDDVACAADDLTSYTGAVLRYRRAADRTTLRIRTDEATTEDVIVRHPGSDDPSPHFRIDGRAFVAADWARIEAAAGRVRAGVRVTAWVCADGAVRIDWTPPRD